MSEYCQKKKMMDVLRLPLEGGLDLTYRCNNNCLHCWLRIPANAEEGKEELSFAEIKGIVDEARKMGCRHWSISGGEPMLRPDFAEIFKYITAKAVSYSLNTNGTLITPQIARLLKRKGSKIVALYGATAEVHDHITRTPGSFESAMEGFSYLKEAGVDFTIQLIPMKANHHQFQEMMRLAKTLSSSQKIGASWLYLRADGDPERNEEIIRQRLSPKEVIEVDKPNPVCKDWMLTEEWSTGCAEIKKGGGLFDRCIKHKREFYVDPYGRMSFCSFIRDPALQYDLRKGKFEEAWQKFIPSLTRHFSGGTEYRKNCGSCELRKNCRWCPPYAYLEHRKFSAKVEYLCAVAKEVEEFKRNWENLHRRYYQIAGITIQVDSDLPIKGETFLPQINSFRVDKPGEDLIRIHNHFSWPSLNERALGKMVYRKVPWAIYKNDDSWVYMVIPSSTSQNGKDGQIAIFNRNHTVAEIYNGRTREQAFLRGGLQSLSLMPTDQILLARILPDRNGCFLHAAGIIREDQGFLFLGHSGAGKSTVVKMLKGHAEILSDDRIIVRQWPQGFKIHGTWSHGEVPEVSPNSAPLKGIFFLEKADENLLLPMGDKKEVFKRLAACLVRPLVSADWWEKSLFVLERLMGEIPSYQLHFNKNGKVLDLLKRIP